MPQAPRIAYLEKMVTLRAVDGVDSDWSRVVAAKQDAELATLRETARYYAAVAATPHAAREQHATVTRRENARMGLRLRAGLR